MERRHNGAKRVPQSRELERYRRCKCVYGDDYMVEPKIKVFQDVKVLLEHKVDIEALTIIGSGQVDITWARLEQSRTAMIPSTAATTKTTRNTSNELSWERAQASSLAGSSRARVREQKRG